MLSTKKAKMSLNKRRERKKFEARELLVAMPRFILGRKARETELLQVRTYDVWTALKLAQWQVGSRSQKSLCLLLLSKYTD